MNAGDETPRIVCSVQGTLYVPCCHHDALCGFTGVSRSILQCTACGTFCFNPGPRGLSLIATLVLSFFVCLLTTTVALGGCHTSLCHVQMFLRPIVDIIRSIQYPLEVCSVYSMQYTLLVGLSPFCFLFWSFLLLFSAEHMLQRDISACQICLFRVDLLPLMLAKMCQLCLLLLLPAQFLLDFCSFARFLLAVFSTCALQRSWPWCVVWHSVHNFTASCVWCLGAVLYILCS